MRTSKFECSGRQSSGVIRLMSKDKNTSSHGDSTKREEREADPVLDRAIGAQLKKLYREVEDEAVPDRFAELLKQLEDQESQKE